MQGLTRQRLQQRLPQKPRPPVRTLKQGPSAEAPRHYWEAQQDSAGAPRHYWSRSEIGIGLEQPPGEGSVAAQVARPGACCPLSACAPHTAAGTAA